MRLLDCKILRKLMFWRFDHEPNGGQEVSAETKAKVVSAYKSLSESEDGQIVLNDLLWSTQVGTDPIVPGDNQQTMANIGAQRVGLRILSMIGTDINQYVVIEKEMRDEKRQENREQGSTAIT